MKSFELFIYLYVYMSFLGSPSLDILGNLARLVSQYWATRFMHKVIENASSVEGKHERSSSTVTSDLWIKKVCRPRRAWQKQSKMIIIMSLTKKVNLILDFYSNFCENLFYSRAKSAVKPHIIRIDIESKRKLELNCNLLKWNWIDSGNL